MSDTVGDLNDREKAAALEDFVTAFREEYFDIEDHWLTVDGGADVSDETVRVLRLMFDAVKCVCDVQGSALSASCKTHGAG